VYNNWHGFISSDSTDIGIELVETECENASFQYFSLSLPLSFLPSFLLSPRLENSKNTSNDILIWLRRLLLTKCWTRTAARVLPCRRRRCARPAHYSPSRLQPLLSPTLEARSIRTAVCSWPQSSRLLFPTRTVTGIRLETGRLQPLLQIQQIPTKCSPTRAAVRPVKRCGIIATMQAITTSKYATTRSCCTFSTRPDSTPMRT